MPGPDIAFHLDLVTGVHGDALLTPVPHPGHVKFRQTCLHPPESARNVAPGMGFCAPGQPAVALAREPAQRRSMTNFSELPAMPSSFVSFVDPLRLGVATYQASFKGSSRDHTESDLRCYLSCCTDHLDPLVCGMCANSSPSNALIGAYSARRVLPPPSGRSASAVDARQGPGDLRALARRTGLAASI
jgi:hypothetical protein